MGMKKKKKKKNRQIYGKVETGEHFRKFAQEDPV